MDPVLAPVLLLSCARDPDPASVDAAVRISVALRGVHPSEAELDAVRSGDLSLEAAARRWVLDPGFGEAMRDLHAEQLLLRIDTRNHLPALGPLEGTPLGPLAESFDEEALRLIEAVVTSGRPYAEILTTPTTMADATLAEAWGLPFDPDGPAWQEVAWTDGRPAAGLLATNSFLQRFESSEQNRHRTRAAELLATLACAPVSAGGVAVGAPGIDEAVREDPACVACHATLDPVAAAWSGMRRYILPSEVRRAERQGCPPDLERDCYPVALWEDELVGDAERWEMPAPAWRGEPVDGLAGLARAVAADPGFEACTARRFRSWFAQEPVPEVDDERAERLAGVLRATGGDARELAVALVLDEDFLALPRRWVRPEQAGRLVEALTGFRWDALPGAAFGAVQVGRTDEFGLRALMGGVDGWDSTLPDPDPSATRELSWRWLASDAAGHAVRTGREPRGGLVTGEEDVRAALADLHRRWLAEEADAEDLDADLELFRGALDRGGAEHAWTVMLTALLLDDRVVGY